MTDKHSPKIEIKGVGRVPNADEMDAMQAIANELPSVTPESVADLLTDFDSAINKMGSSMRKAQDEIRKRVEYDISRKIDDKGIFLSDEAKANLVSAQMAIIPANLQVRVLTGFVFDTIDLMVGNTVSYTTMGLISGMQVNAQQAIGDLRNLAEKNEDNISLQMSTALHIDMLSAVTQVLDDAGKRLMHYEHQRMAKFHDDATTAFSTVSEQLDKLVAKNKEQNRDTNS